MSIYIKCYIESISNIIPNIVNLHMMCIYFIIFSYHN